MTDKKALKDIEKVLKKNQDNECPQKDGDNCLVPGVYSDSDPISGG